MNLQKTIEYIKSHQNNSEVTINDEDINTILNLEGIKQTICITTSQNNNSDFISQLSEHIQIEKLKNIKGFLAFFETNQNISLFAVNNIMIELYEIFDGEPQVIFGTTYNQNINSGDIRCSIIMVI